MNKTFSRFFLSFLLLTSIFTVSLPQTGYAQASTQTQISTDLQSALAQIEQKVEARRKELGIPGMSLAIVKDGEIIYAKGFGYKDFPKQIPVTPDTEFAIGSATKAFTALSVLMSQQEGKLNIDDNPKKYLSYFKINNADTNARITIRDLLSHSSGLNRTDLAMVTGKLTREELIRVAGEAKPTAGLREKFQYQNIMFAAAGEIVAKVQKQSWESFVADRIFKPLGMTNTNISIGELEKAKDYSFGYEYNFDTKETRAVPFKSIDASAPAGAINSSANDMSKWLKFMLNGGELGGKRLVSENLFAELVKPQMKVTPDGKMSYGFGWFLQDWKGLKVVQHGGNIDGFNSLVAMIPEKKLGFVMLTNVSSSSIGGEIMPLIWESILGEKKTDETVKLPLKAMEKLVGKYRFAAANVDIEVKIENETLVMNVPGQPTYTLQRTGEREFKLVGAPDGFAVKFTPAQDDATEMFLQQPQGNYTLPRVNADGTVTAKVETVSTGNPAKELVGKYQTPSGKGTIEIKEVDGKVSLVVEGQQPYELKEKEKDAYSLNPLPDSYSMKIKRATDGKLEGIVLVQPEGEFPFKFVGAVAVSDTPKISVDEVMTKTIAALGGEANRRKVTSREMKFDLDFEQQGVKGYGTTYAKAPNLFATDATFTALGKPIGTEFEYFDGTNGGEIVSFADAETYTGKRLEDVKLTNDFYGLVNWKNDLKSAEVSGMAKVGEEDVYVVTFHPEKASDYTYYISTKTFLPLKKASLIVSSTSSMSLPITETFSDYRAVDGVMIPFKTLATSPSMGNVITYIKEVKNNAPIEDKMFKPKK
jgi:CubicO group peptidase (beta-lactamase class C family)